MSENNDENTKKWAEGDRTHGGRGFDVRGLAGCIRVKSCRELGGVDVAIFETAVAFPNRASDTNLWTVKVIGMGQSGPMLDTKTRAQAMAAARHPSTWSKKCADVAAKVRETKEAKVAQKTSDEEE